MCDLPEIQQLILKPQTLKSPLKPDKNRNQINLKRQNKASWLETAKSTPFHQAFILFSPCPTRHH